MNHYLFTALGGAIGATLRYGIGRWAQDFLGQPGFPYGTLLINVSGCMVFGFITGLLDDSYAITPEQRTLTLVGILAGTRPSRRSASRHMPSCGTDRSCPRC